MPKKTKIGSKNPKYNKEAAAEVQVPVRSTETYKAVIRTVNGKATNRTADVRGVWFS